MGIAVGLLLRDEQALMAFAQSSGASLKLANELKQSSDDLTRFARTYAATADPRYENYFQAILAIRDGKRPRPRDYGPFFWDQVTAGVADLDQAGETYALEARMGNWASPPRSGRTWSGAKAGLRRPDAPGGHRLSRRQGSIPGCRGAVHPGG